MIYLKSEAELERLQESANLVSDTLNQILHIVEPGLPTIEIDRLAEKIIRGYGAVPAFKGYRGFPYSVCVSINEQVVHGFPSERVLEEGDILSVDVGVIYRGYVGDCARSVGVGPLPLESEHLIRRAYYALREAGKVVRAGNRIGDVSNTIQCIAEQFGYGVVRDFVGHGVGRKMHEDPQVPNFGRPGTGQRIQKGLVIAIEPMFNLGTHAVEVMNDNWTVVTKDRLRSVHVEDMVAVFDDGPRILTSANGRIYPDDLETPSAAPKE